MSIKAKLTGLAIAAGILAGAPAAYADFPYTCDSAACFATWCAGNLRDCTDLNSPQWVYCDGDVCWACSGDIPCYALYCTVVYSPVRCAV